MKNILKISAVTAMAVMVLTGCSTGENTNVPETDKVQDKGTVTIDEELQENFESVEQDSGMVFAIRVTEQNGKEWEEIYNNFIKQNKVTKADTKSNVIFATKEQIQELVCTDGYDINLSFDLENSITEWEVNGEIADNMTEKDYLRVYVHIKSEIVRSLENELDAKGISDYFERKAELENSVNGIAKECGIDSIGYVFSSGTFVCRVTRENIINILANDCCDGITIYQYGKVEDF